MKIPPFFHFQIVIVSAEKYALPYFIALLPYPKRRLFFFHTVLYCNLAAAPNNDYRVPVLPA